MPESKTFFDRSAPPSVAKAVGAIMAEIVKTGVAKDRTNTGQNFKFRGIDDVMNALSPLLAKHGLIIFPRILEREMSERRSHEDRAIFSVLIRAEYDFIAVEDGALHTVGPYFGEAMDSGDKATSKATAIAYKYACTQAFCIPTEGENDPDEHSHEVKVEEPGPPPPTPEWDGSRLVGFTQKYRQLPWRDVPVDFLDWCESATRLTAEQKRFAQLEKARRAQERAKLPTDLPEGFYR